MTENATIADGPSGPVSPSGSVNADVQSTPDSAPKALVLTIDDMAVTCATSVRTIRRLNSAGRIPRPLRLGGQLRWRRAEIEDWIDAGMPDRKTWERTKWAKRHS